MQLLVEGIKKKNDGVMGGVEEKNQYMDGWFTWVWIDMSGDWAMLSGGWGTVLHFRTVLPLFV